MWGKRLIALVAVATMAAIGTALGEETNPVLELRFESSVSTVNSLYEANNGFSLSPTGEPDLPWQVVSAPLKWELQGSLEVTILEADTLSLSHFVPPRQPDRITSDTTVPPPPVAMGPGIYGVEQWYPGKPLRMSDAGHINGQPLASIAWCPFRYNPVRNRLIVIRRAVIRRTGIAQGSPPAAPPDTVHAIEDPAVLALSRLRASEVPPPAAAPGWDHEPSWTPSADPPLGVTYVAITDEPCIDAVRRLVNWKARRGINAGLATVTAIRAAYPGTDAAESVREYLKAAYAAGLQWVLLCGDETIVPVRYAYAGYSSTVTDPYQLQICDMYFAELDGDWDADGDGIYGEYFGDQAEMTTELYVGRLPFSDADEAAAIIDKIIAYEQGPADASYLTHVLSVSADQMRDWANGIGQQQEVAESMPEGWTFDNTSMIELPTGNSPQPTAPDGPDLPSLIAEGFGWVNYFVHGRADGMVVRASGYSEWPKSYVWTSGSSGDGHGHFNQMPQTPTPGIHLSIGCDHGAFDMDSPPFPPGYGESVVERLLFTPQGGAVAFVAQSRWGWVSSSFRILEAFYGHVADPAIPNHIGVYHSLAKLALPNYRDLIFGNNLYGDPEMPVWKETPRELGIEAPTVYSSSESSWTVLAHDAGGPVSDALATIAIGDTVWNLGLTGADGSVSAELTLPTRKEVILTVSKSSYRTFVDTIPHAIISDVGDDETTIDLQPAIFTCSPNPFNPSSTLSFSVTQHQHVEITIYNILGRRVRTLLDADTEPGLHHLSFNGRDDRGQSLASGVYLARLSQGNSSRVVKMVLLR
jgi:hypothetical protein